MNYSSVLLGTAGSTALIVYSHQAMIHGMNTIPAVLISPPAKVSIIMKNLNEEGYIARGIESLLNQRIIKTYPDSFEFIVVDGGSEDRSVDIIRQYPVKLVQTTRGILHQMNEGYKNSSGDIIVFVDSDCFYPEYWMEKLLAGFKPDVSMVTTSLWNEDGSNSLNALGMLFKGLVYHSYGAGTAVRSDVFEQVGGFDESCDCVMFKRVFQEAELNFTERVGSLGRFVYQFENPFIHPMRREYKQNILHECVRNPKNMNCRFAQEIGVTRF